MSEALETTPEGPTAIDGWVRIYVTGFRKVGRDNYAVNIPRAMWQALALEGDDEIELWADVGGTRFEFRKSGRKRQKGHGAS